MNKYLSEKALINTLEELYETDDWVNNKGIPKDIQLSRAKELTKMRLFRPDYRSEKLSLIIEFDGVSHYTTPSVILNDIDKVKFYNQLGYKVIQIPYFVQIDTHSIKHYFDKELEYESNLMHGFNIINNKPNQNNPAIFSELGIKKFEREYNNLPEIIQNEIKQTLQTQLNTFNIQELIVPSALDYLLE